MSKADAILKLFQTDEERAFNQLYEAYYEPLVLFAHQIIGESAAVEDVVQDCFVDFWTSKRYRTLEAGLDKYMFQAVKYSSLNYLRGKQKKKALYDRVVQEMDKEEEMKMEEEVDVMAEVYKTIDLLPEDRKRIFLMLFVEGRSYQEIADALQISKNTVKTQLSRALGFLRNLLKDKYIPFLLLIIDKK